MKIDDLGRIVIPKNIRKQLNIKAGDILNLEVENENIILTTNKTERIKAELERYREMLRAAIDLNLKDEITVYTGYIKALEWVLEEDNK